MFLCNWWQIAIEHDALRYAGIGGLSVIRLVEHNIALTLQKHERVYLVLHRGVTPCPVLETKWKRI